MILLLDKDGLVSPLEKMTYPSVSLVEKLGVDAV
jgi:hypothetical protein